LHETAHTETTTAKTRIVYFIEMIDFTF
jgi:hypothetical protein